MRQKRGDIEGRRRPCEDEGRDWSDAATAKDHLKSPEAGRGQQEFLTKDFERSMALPTP